MVDAMDVSNFYVDREKGKEGEKIVFNMLQEKFPQYLIEDVSDDPECFYKGDLTIFNMNAYLDGASEEACTKFVEVKTDDRIGSTRNVLCEYSVYYPQKNETKPGNMQCQSDFYCVVSRDTREIFMFDFKKLQKIFKRGRFVNIPHKNDFGELSQITNAFLLPLSIALEERALRKIYKY